MSWIRKILIRLIILGSIAILLSTFKIIYPNSDLLSTLYTVCGIMFSIGLSLIVTFNLSNIRNKNYLTKIKRNLRYIRNSFMWYFTIATFAFIGESYLPTENLNLYVFQTNKGVLLSWWSIFLVAILFAIIYFIINFLALQKLSTDIYDRVNEETML